MRDPYIKHGQGFVLLYAINDRRSFDELGKHFHDICRVKEAKTIPCVIVGNKCDLVAERKVSEEEGQELAEEINNPFLETSAKERINVEESFSELIKCMRICYSSKAKNQTSACALM